MDAGEVRIVIINLIISRGRKNLYQLCGDPDYGDGFSRRIQKRYIWNTGGCAFIVGTRLTRAQWNRMPSTKVYSLREMDKENKMLNEFHPVQDVL